MKKYRPDLSKVNGFKVAQIANRYVQHATHVAEAYCEEVFTRNRKYIQKSLVSGIRPLTTMVIYGVDSIDKLAIAPNGDSLTDASPAEEAVDIASIPDSSGISEDSELSDQVIVSPKGDVTVKKPIDELPEHGE